MYVSCVGNAGKAFMTEGIVQSDFEKCKVHRESMCAVDRACSIARRMLNRDEILFYRMPTDSPV